MARQIMTRQIYENSLTKSAELTVITAVSDKWKCRFEKLPIKNRIDYALFRENGLAGYAEVKCRNVAHDRYQTFMLSLDKWMHAKLISEASNGVPVFIVVGFTDGIFYIRQDTVIFTVGVGGRTDRGDEHDQELCVFIDSTRFRSL